MKPQFEAAIQYALGRLQSELSAELTYHDLWHTKHGVMVAATILCEGERVQERDCQLVQVAAAFHDIGFVETYHEHEETAVSLIQHVLPNYHFCQTCIDTVAGMILATRLPQTPKTKLEQILADADLDVLGREDFFIRNERLRQEQGHYGRFFTEKEWLENQRNFLQNHRYFTKTAVARREAGKQSNLRQLTEMLRLLE